MKKFLFAFLHATRVVHLLAWLNRDRVGILCYHSVTGRSQRLSDDPHKLHLPLPLFLKHLDYLQSNFHLISLSELLSARRDGRKLPSNSRVLTFDDSFRNFATLVAPELLRREIPATAFLVTEMSNQEPANGFHGWTEKDDSSHLSWEEVRILIGKGMEFGSHTSSHPRLLELSFDDARREFVGSRATIVQQVGEREIALSYPHGKASSELSELAEAVGYSCGLTTELGFNDERTNLFQLRRTVIAGDDDLATFAARVSGLTWWVDKFSRPLRAAAAAQVQQPGSYVTQELDIDSPLTQR